MNLDRYAQSNGERRRLSGQLEQRGAQSGLGTRGMFLFGVPFLGIGVWIILVGTKVIHVDPSTVHAPHWVLTVCGVCFGLGGVMAEFKAVRQFRANRRKAQVRRRNSDNEALADYAWNPRGNEGPRWTPVAKALGGAVFITVFLSIFNWWAFFARGPWPVKIIVGLFDAFGLWAWGWAVLQLGRALKFGGSRIEFARFPYRLGEPIVIRWQPATGINRAPKGTFTLRCIEEWWETGGSGDNRSTRLVHEEQWSGTWFLEKPREFPAGKTVELSYELPENARPTTLSDARPVFWEFEVKLDLPGLDFVETYLVPIYAAPPAA